MTVEFAVILVEPEYQLNIGFVARSMKNFGVRELILVNPKVKISGEAYKFSVHAQDVLENAKIVESLEEALEMVDLAVGTSGVSGKQYLPARTPITPEEFAKRAFLYNGKIGLVFGRESRGLDNKELEKLDFTVTIPTSEEYPILNLSHAVAVLLYEIYKQKLKTLEVKNPLRKASREEREMFVKLWRELIEIVGYPKDLYKRHYAEIMMRRILGRSFIYARELHSLFGPLRWAITELKRCKEE
jgi:TrmH family RNA methyltransferase